MRLVKKSLLAAAIATACGAAMAASLPQIEVLATGGTIAGSGNSATGSAYTAGKVSVNHLVAAVPQLADIAQVTPKQVVQIGSQDMTDDVWLKLAKTINHPRHGHDGRNRLLPQPDRQVQEACGARWRHAPLHRSRC